MPKPFRKKATRLNIRTEVAQKQRLKLAAKKSKQTLSEFILNSAEERAAALLKRASEAPRAKAA